MPVQRIEFRINSHPEHLRVASFVSFIKKVECFFGPIELTRDERQMIRRHVTTFSELVHVVEDDLSCLEISRGGMGVGESSQRVRSLAHQFHTLFRSRDRLRMTPETTQ